MDIDKILQDLGYWIYSILGGLVGILYFIIKKTIPFIKPIFNMIAKLQERDNELNVLKKDVKELENRQKDLENKQITLCDIVRGVASNQELILEKQASSTVNIVEKLETISENISEIKKDVKESKTKIDDLDKTVAIHDEKRKSTNRFLIETRDLLKETNEKVDNYILEVVKLKRERA